MLPIKNKYISLTTVKYNNDLCKYRRRIQFFTSQINLARDYHGVRDGSEKKNTYFRENYFTENDRLALELAPVNTTNGPPRVMYLNVETVTIQRRFVSFGVSEDAIGSHEFKMMSTSSFS